MLVFTVVACSSGKKNESVTPSPSPTSPQETSPTPTETPATLPTPTPEPVVPGVPEGVLISYLSYTIHKVSEDPLFKANGDIDTDVLESLMEVLNDPKLDPMLRAPKMTWPTGMLFEGKDFKEVTAEDFSNFVVPNPTNMSVSGAVVIKLFETVPEKTGVHNSHLTEFTSQWWQLVYRATDDDSDVLTLWMMQPYRVTPFNGTRFDRSAGTLADRFTDRVRAFGDNAFSRLDPGIINTVFSDERLSLGLPPCNNYFFEGNYSTSIIRDNLFRDTQAIIDNFNVEEYIATPESLPGYWQSSVFQTGKNMENEFYASGQFYRTDDNVEFTGSEDIVGGLGATGLIWDDFKFFALLNGMDGLSVGPFYSIWPNSFIEPTYNDLFWLPSDFEVRTMGYDKDDARVTTVLADAYSNNSMLVPNREIYDEDGEIIRNHIGTGRSGLWRLNGFDRSFDLDGLGLPRGWMTLQVWLRSCDSLAVGNANVVLNTGSRSGYGVHQLAGMRPAMHILISELKELIDD